MLEVYSKWIGHIRTTDFNDLSNAIKSLALNGLRHVIDSNAGEFDCIDQIKNEAILYQESLNLILTGRYVEPVFDMR